MNVKINKVKNINDLISRSEMFKAGQIIPSRVLKVHPKKYRSRVKFGESVYVFWCLGNPIIWAMPESYTMVLKNIFNAHIDCAPYSPRKGFGADSSAMVACNAEERIVLEVNQLIQERFNPNIYLKNKLSTFLRIA